MLMVIRERNEMVLRMMGTDGFRLTCLKVFEQLTRWENSVTGYTQPSQGVIGARIGRSRKAVNQAVAWLREHEFVRTQQRYVLHRDRTLYGTLRYWVAKELGQVEWLRKAKERERMTKSNKGHLANGVQIITDPTERQDLRAKRWRMPDVSGKQEVERYWLAKLGCNPGVSTPSNTESNSEILMSPALKRWVLNEQRRR